MTPRLTRRTLQSVGIAGLCALSALALFRTGWLDAAEYKALDFQFRRAADPRQAHPDLVAVMVDEASIGAIGRWPWKRDTHAYAVRFLRAAGAKLVAFDINFPEADACDPDLDAVLAAAIGEAGNVLLPVRLDSGSPPSAGTPPESFGVRVRRSSDAYADAGTGSPGYGRVEFPIPSLRDAAGSFGFNNLSPDPDGTTRHLPLLADAGSQTVPSLALAAFLQATGARELIRTGTDLTVGTTRIPLEAGDRLLINWHGSWEQSPYRSYSYGLLVQSGHRLAKGLPPLINPALFKNAIVFVGSNAAGTFDLRVTPPSPIAPGVLIHMAALDDLLQGRFVTRETFSTVAGLTLLLCLSTAGLFAAIARAQWQVLAIGALAVGYLLAATATFSLWHRWIPTVMPLGAQALTFAGLATLEYWTEGRMRRQIRNAFNTYMSPEVVDEIMRRPDLITLGGEQRCCTVMFVDIAGFTTISEQLEPAALLQLLNRLLTTMTGVIRRHRGNVNKYLGDGLMAMFGAPLMDGDHAALACRAAASIQDELAAVRAGLEAEGYPRMAVRIGLTTGPLIVGNVGAPDRLEYTVIGDTVNLASRLEGANKFYGTSVLLSEDTWEAARDEFAARPVDCLRVKGKTQPVTVYELIGSRTGISPETQAMLAEYELGMQSYRRRAFEQAATCFDAVLRARPADGPARVLRERAMRYASDPPPESWDGVYDLESK